MAIDGARLADDLETCFRLTSDQVTTQMIRRQIEKIRLDSTIITQNTRPTLALAELVGRNMELFFVEEKAQALRDCTVYVVPLPLCAAYSSPANPIVIGSGLLNVIAACGYWAYNSELLPVELDAIKPLQRFPGVSARQAVPLLLFALIYRHYQFGEPLPDFRAWNKTESREALDQKVRHSVAGAAAFILLHELGHLALMHHDPETPVHPADIPLAVQESLSDYQLQEFEADDFAMTSLKPEYQKLHFAWINMALNFHLQRETMLGERGCRHPVNINRLNYAFARCNGVQQGDYHAAHLQRMGLAHENIEHNHNELARQNRKGLLASFERDEILGELAGMAQYLAPHNIDLDAVTGENCELDDWTRCLF